MDRRFLTILAVIVLVFVGILISTGKSNDKSSQNKTNSPTTAHYLGSNQNGVTLTEYGDYQCPVCGTYYAPLKDAYTKFSAVARFQFANLPLVSVHPNAFAAARAAEAAGMQNKYWEMHDMLYENQSDWAGSQNASTLFAGYAKDIGLDVNKFKQDFASTKANDSINADLAAFDKTGQNVQTPSFFLNGKYVPNEQLLDPNTGRPSSDKIVALVQAEVNKNTKH